MAHSYENLPHFRVEPNVHTPLYMLFVIYHKDNELFDAVAYFY